MISRIKIENFKSHKRTELFTTNLTVLTGANGVGKSSVVQLLLLIRESFLANSDFEYLDLRSNPVNVGTAKDALYQFGENNKIKLEVDINDKKLSFSFEASDADLVKTLILKEDGTEHFKNRVALASDNLFSKQFQYISAARVGPQPSYPKDDVVVQVYNQISVMEGKAEHFVHFLNTNKDRDVLEHMKKRPEEPADLLTQTTLWERRISEGVNVIIQDLGNLGYDLKFQFNTESLAGKTFEYKASNVGFGLTYVMPIIVAILSAPEGSLLILENPEAHLHPDGQASIAELISFAAQSGVQIILETHSDHIINGILVQAKNFEQTGKGIERNKIKFYFFDRDETNHSSIFEEVEVVAGGRLKNRPEGFFDRIGKDVRNLILQKNG